MKDRQPCSGRCSDRGSDHESEEKGDVVHILRGKGTRARRDACSRRSPSRAAVVVENIKRRQAAPPPSGPIQNATGFGGSGMSPGPGIIELAAPLPGLERDGRLPPCAAKPTRVGTVEKVRQGTGKSAVRVCKQCGEEIDRT